MLRRLVVAGALLWAVCLLAPSLAGAQETPPTVIDGQHIIPRPNSGHAPAEAGDRGGALQLTILGVLVVGISGAAVHLVRDSRRGRSTTP